MVQDILHFQFQNGGQIFRDKLVGGLRIVGQLAAALLGLLHRLLVALLGLHQVPGRELHVVDCGAHGQHLTVAVIDGAPVGGDGAVPGLLLDRQVLIILMLADLDLPQLDKQRYKGHQAKNRHQKQAANQNGAVGAPIRTLPDHAVAFLSLCHNRLTSLVGCCVFIFGPG